MDDKNVQSRRTRSTEPGHEFETPIVKELPREAGQPERQRCPTRSTQSDATLSDAGTEE